MLKREKEEREEAARKKAEMHNQIDIYFDFGYSVLLAGRKAHQGYGYSYYGDKRNIWYLLNRLTKRYINSKL